MGRIRVAIELDAPGPELPPRLVGQVRLLRYVGVDADTAEILAGDPFGGALEPGRCEVQAIERRLDDALGRTSSWARIDHLDAGEIRVQAAGVVASAWPTLQPALFPVVNGVEYADARSENAVHLGLEDRGAVVVTAFGGIDVGPFDLVAAAPAVPGSVAAIRREGRVEVSWAPADVDIGAAVIISAGVGHGRVLRCRAANPGSMVIYDGALAGLAPDAPVDLTVERSRRLPFHAPGIAEGTLEVAARYVVTAVPLRAAEPTR
ncbi:MAG TPA: hypothetical protein VML75_16835 [Kofleriaceae bacterium]|nr:hypothetical protein [Kofleriaceae bacterium]